MPSKCHEWGWSLPNNELVGSHHSSSKWSTINSWCFFLVQKVSLPSILYSLSPTSSTTIPLLPSLYAISLCLLYKIVYLYFSFLIHTSLLKEREFLLVLIAVNDTICRSKVAHQQLLKVVSQTSKSISVKILMIQAPP